MITKSDLISSGKFPAACRGVVHFNILENPAGFHKVSLKLEINLMQL